MNKEIKIFIKEYVKELLNNSAAVFLGAGFSKSAGFVNWKELLKDIAEELELDINKENDLISLAQYYCNKNKRCKINSTIFEEFTKDVSITENHEILVRLPIETYWTTNYDSLIEDALKNNKKNPDVKYKVSQLANTLPERDAVIYKMHGDKSEPDEAVIIKDDYEQYYRKYAPFITALSGDLISKTFLFIGFSFTDPNLEYILSRIRVDYTGAGKQHYAILKKIDPHEDDYEYKNKKQEYFIEDLKRYNIKALLIDDYKETKDILSSIEMCINQKNIFISGSAEKYGDLGKEISLNFIHKLSECLIDEGYNIISGFGLGVGSSVITGALQRIYSNGEKINKNRLLLRPFPQKNQTGTDIEDVWNMYRRDMISRAGISIYLFGNKIDQENNDIILAQGVRSEFNIAKNYNNILIPIGATGYMAKKLWDEVNEDFNNFFPNKDSEVRDLFEKLNEYSSIDELVNNIISFINKVKER